MKANRKQIQVELTTSKQCNTIQYKFIVKYLSLRRGVMGMELTTRKREWT